MGRKQVTGATVLLGVAAMFIIALADFAIKQSSGKISPSLGTLVYAVVTVLPPLLWVLWARTQGPLQITRDGVFWSVVTGLAFGVFTGMLFLLYSQGVNLSIGSPVIRMGGIVIAATLGILAFREPLNLQYAAGFILAAVGILLVATR